MSKHPDGAQDNTVVLDNPHASSRRLLDWAPIDRFEPAIRTGTQPGNRSDESPSMNRGCKHAAILGAVGVLLAVALGWTTDHDVNFSQGQERAEWRIFGVYLSTSPASPSDFTRRFPAAVSGRSPGRWYSLGGSGIGGARVNGFGTRTAQQLRGFTMLADQLDVDDADRIASRLVDLIEDGIEFQIEYDNGVLIMDESGALLDLGSSR